MKSASLPNIEKSCELQGRGEETTQSGQSKKLILEGQIRVTEVTQQ